MKEEKFISQKKAIMYGFYGVLLGMALMRGFYAQKQVVVETEVIDSPDSVVAKANIQASMVSLAAPPKKEKGYVDYLDEVLLNAEPLSLARYHLILDYHDIAKIEQEKFGIPVSIKLAQMIFEGGYKDDSPDGSYLAQYYKNPFGIKYQRDYYPTTVPSDIWDKLAYKGEYGKYYDDCGDKKCKFMHFKSIWSAMRFHSYFLAGTPDNRSMYYVEGDWEDWVASLQRNGYATSDEYAKKITRLIKQYKLYLLDK